MAKCTKCLDRVKIGLQTEANEAEEPHTCPFQSDVYDDDEFLCTCCNDCAHECAMYI